MIRLLSLLVLVASTGPAPAANAPSGEPSRPAVEELKVPVEIRGAQVKYIDREGRADFTGGVRVLRGTSTLTADSLRTIRGPNEAEASGHVVFTDLARQVVLSCESARYAHGLREIAARGRCILTLGAGDQLATVTSDAMELLVDPREAHAHGGVKIVQGGDEASSEDARLYGATNRVVLTGSPVLRRSPHEFRCVEARYDLKEYKTVLLGPVTGTLHAGHLDALKGGTP